LCQCIEVFGPYTTVHLLIGRRRPSGDVRHGPLRRYNSLKIFKRRASGGGGISSSGKSCVRRIRGNTGGDASKRHCTTHFCVDVTEHFLNPENLSETFSRITMMITVDHCPRPFMKIRHLNLLEVLIIVTLKKCACEAGTLSQNNTLSVYMHMALMLLCVVRN
jgi:hypothetical protein